MLETELSCSGKAATILNQTQMSKKKSSTFSGFSRFELLSLEPKLGLSASVLSAGLGPSAMLTLKPVLSSVLMKIHISLISNLSYLIVQISYNN